MVSYHSVINLPTIQNYSSLIIYVRSTMGTNYQTIKNSVKHTRLCVNGCVQHVEGAGQRCEIWNDTTKPTFSHFPSLVFRTKVFRVALRAGLVPLLRKAHSSSCSSEDNRSKNFVGKLLGFRCSVPVRLRPLLSVGYYMFQKGAIHVRRILASRGSVVSFIAFGGITTYTCTVVVLLTVLLLLSLPSCVVYLCL